VIQDPRGAIDYHEVGSGPCIVMVPGSCSTGVAWRSVIAKLGDRYRCVTTSLLGYGATTERRTATSFDMALEVDALEAVVRQAAAPVHLVGHSFGGLVGVAVAARGQVPLASLTVLEAPAVGVMDHHCDRQSIDAFRRMTDGYFDSYESGDKKAIAAMIDFYGGAGTFTSWPTRVCDYAMKTTPTNILDWATAYAFSPSLKVLQGIDIPVHIVIGEKSNPAIKRANLVLSELVPRATLAWIPGAAHFMIATHADDVARHISHQVYEAEITSELPLTATPRDQTDAACKSVYGHQPQSASAPSDDQGEN
jgi:pimeloyl-ACP methyl ester carboxylesterase